MRQSFVFREKEAEDMPKKHWSKWKAYIDDKMRWEAPGQHPPRFVFMDGASCFYYFVLFFLYLIPSIWSLPLPLVTKQWWSLVQKISMHDDDDHDMLAMDAFFFPAMTASLIIGEALCFCFANQSSLFSDSAWVTTHARWWKKNMCQLTLFIVSL